MEAICAPETSVNTYRTTRRHALFDTIYRAAVGGIPVWFWNVKSPWARDMDFVSVSLLLEMAQWLETLIACTAMTVITDHPTWGDSIRDFFSYQYWICL
jgi:hypothetical protein